MKIGVPGVSDIVKDEFGVYFDQSRYQDHFEAEKYEQMIYKLYTLFSKPVASYIGCHFKSRDEYEMFVNDKGIKDHFTAHDIFLLTSPNLILERINFECDRQQLPRFEKFSVIIRSGG